MAGEPAAPICFGQVLQEATMGSFSGIHWFVVLLIIVLLFGASKIPDLARSIGLAMKEFKKATREDDTDTKTTKSKPEEIETKKKE
jgi:sec-independent protein translocase protein TatA